MTGELDLSFLPLAGWLAVSLAALAGVVAMLAGGRLAARFAFGMAAFLVALGLAGPQLDRLVRVPLDDVVVLLTDESSSQDEAMRNRRTASAAEALRAQIAALDGVELREAVLNDGAQGTDLAPVLSQIVSDTDPRRLSAVIMLSDGQISDAVRLPALPEGAMLHLGRSTGERDWDQRLEVETRPHTAIVGETVQVQIRMLREGDVPVALRDAPALLRIARDGREIQSVLVPPDQSVAFDVEIERPGPVSLSLSLDPPPSTPDAAPFPPQASRANDRVSFGLEAIRARLRVLLISGAPNEATRSWRDLLGGDAGVDLVHFTILRSPDKADPVPADEMSLIAFPVDELFAERLSDFDLVVFDRYARRGILAPQYFANLRDYVLEGGAVLLTGADELAGPDSLALTALGSVMPARPSGRVATEPFRPTPTEIAGRHPVTAAITGPEAEKWGRWMRHAGLLPQAGAQILLRAGAAADDALLVLGAAGQGRVAMLGSDQIWLWGRGVDGGGPQNELIRRLAHWAMGEPALDPERLDIAPVQGENLAIEITRHTLSDTPPELSIAPVFESGRPEVLSWNDTAADGALRRIWRAPAPGLYVVQAGDVSKSIALGPSEAEIARPLAPPAGLAAHIAQSGGRIFALDEPLPNLRRAHSGGAQDLLLPPREATRITGAARRPLAPIWLYGLLAAAFAALGWIAERRDPRLP